MAVTTVSGLVGNTPIVSLTKIAEQAGVSANILAKLEMFNLTGSVKDRVALSLIQDAEEHSKLAPGGIIIEPSSGNTGIGLAALGTALGYQVWITMPDSVSVERRAMIQGFGGTVFLTPGKLGMKGAIALANKLHEDTPGSIIPGQFTNQANVLAHYRTTGPEIWRDLDGKVDVLVAGVGTGGTISGVGQYLLEQNPDIKIIAVEPANSAVLSGQQPAPHKIQGIGAGFIPEILRRDLIDEIIQVTDEDSINTAKNLGMVEGIYCGISSGAALVATLQVASRPEFAGKNIVTVFPDSANRYFSTALADFGELTTTQISLD